MACLQLLAHDFICDHLLHLALLAALHHLQSLGLLLNLTEEAAECVAQPLWPQAWGQGWQLLQLGATAEAAVFGSTQSAKRHQTATKETLTDAHTAAAAAARDVGALPAAFTTSSMQHSQPQTCLSCDAAAYTFPA